MLDAASFFAEFKGSGLLAAATWTPPSSAPVAFEVRLMKGDMSGIAMLGGRELMIQFIAADAPGLSQGASVMVNGAAYVLRARAEEHCSADGTLVAYEIRETA